MSMIRLLSVITLLAALLFACAKPTLPAAPLNEITVLQQLADAYKQKLQEYPTAPQGMRPEGRKQFVEQVFRSAGYDYTATLASLAHELNTGNKEQRDLAELVSLPFRSLSNAALEELFSGDALKNARLLRQRLKQ